MSRVTVEANRLQGRLIPPPDKSISHRAIIIGCLAQGQTSVKNLSLCDDCLRSIDAFKGMGISINKKKDCFTIGGRGRDGLRQPSLELYLGNSGTSMRLILGVLAGQKFGASVSGDASLSRRPMKRVIIPLSSMGARITGKGRSGDFAPLSVQGGKLKSISYQMPVASAQVKSAILLAGLYAPGTTIVREPAKSRDHTERMLKKFGADISVEGLSVSVQGRANLVCQDIEVPGDISSASFFLVGACISGGSQLTVERVGLNPTRIAFLKLLQKMGADVSWRYEDKRMAAKNYEDEAKGEITARYSQLKSITINPEQVPSVIDELPILMVAATQAEGETKICGAGELRVKETDRIKAMVTNLSRMGVEIKSANDDVIIRGPSGLKGCVVDSFGDHRIAMCMAIAGLIAKGPTTIKDADCVNISFPGFFKALSKISF